MGLYAQQKQKSDSIFFECSPLPRGVPTTIAIKAVDRMGNLLEDFNEEVEIKGLYLHHGSKPIRVVKRFHHGVLQIKHIEYKGYEVQVEVRKDVEVFLKKSRESYKLSPFTFSPWLTLLPPLLAIFLAIVTKEVLLSLLVGIWAGVFVVEHYRPFYSFFSIIDTYLIHTLTDPDYMRIIVFSLSIGGMIGIIANSGGISDLVERISRWARTPRSGILVTWFMGLIIFFDE